MAQPRVVSGDMVILDVTTFPVISPESASIETTRDLPMETRQRLGFVERAEVVSYGPGENPNLIYQKAMPFPEMRFIRTEPFQVTREYGPGVEAVEAYRWRWPWPPPDPNSIPQEERVVSWRWKVPESLQESYPAWANRLGKERYAVLCLYPANRPAWEHDPMLFYFDALSGLRWQATVPVIAALQEYGTNLSLQVLSAHDDGISNRTGMGRTQNR